jgi:ABC-2 type transport system ATP-binding protein
VILSTHILAEVDAICHRVILINQGRKVVDAPLSELKSGGRTLDQVFTQHTAHDVVDDVALPTKPTVESESGSES